MDTNNTFDPEGNKPAEEENKQYTEHPEHIRSAFSPADTGHGAEQSSPLEFNAPQTPPAPNVPENSQNNQAFSPDRSPAANQQNNNADGVFFNQLKQPAPGEGYYPQYNNTQTPPAPPYSPLNTGHQQSGAQWNNTAFPANQGQPVINQNQPATPIQPQSPYQPVTPNQTPYQAYRPQAQYQQTQAYPNNRYTPYPQVQQPYGYMPPYGQPPVPPKKEKMNTGTKVFISTLFAVFGVLLISYFVFLSMQISNGNGDISNIFSTTEPTTSDGGEPDPSDSDSIQGTTEVPLTDPANEGLDLLPLPNDKDNGKYTIQSAYEKVGPSIVGVTCYTSKSDAESEDADELVASQGTGIIITENGYIVTNSHVINNSKKYYVMIIFSDGSEYPANIVGYDARTDLAVLKINKSGLSYANFGNSDLITIGDDVIAIGNPGGMSFQNSLTKGIVSAVNRSVSTSSTVKYIQTDAAINPGNSGGPLCNIYGQVIGINTVKIVAEQYEGMGFSIPSNTVKDIADDLIKQGYVSNRVRIGITGIAVSSEMQNMYDVPPGVVIESVAEDGPLHNKGVKKGDILTKIDGEDISSIQDIYAILAEHEPGDTISIEIFRAKQSGAKEKTFTVKAVLTEDAGETQE